MNNPLAVLLLGLIAFVFRSNAINDWRDQLRGKNPRELVNEFPNSWKLNRDEVLGISHRFIKLQVRTTRDNKPYRLTLGFPQWNEIRDFGKAHGWPIEGK